ncbi:NAD(P)-binding protein [Xylariaceae sp. FL0594]|nr:NAD(P)-binding protein [Xylariaceae sp. FL0594]
MPSYVITGVSRGLGWEFLDQLSANADNIVIGIVRNKPAADKRVAEELPGRTNITILEADINDYDQLKKAAADAATVTGGRLDHLIANAAHLTPLDAYDGIGTIAEQSPGELAKEFRQMMDTNVLANIHLYSLFLPQIRAGDARYRKVVAVSSGVADNDWTDECEIEPACLNAMSKAALNVVTAKFHAQYGRREGILFLSVCPGLVDAGHFVEPTPPQQEKLNKLLASFARYSSTFKGPDTPANAIRDVLSVIDSSSLEKGDGGRFLSHFGNKQWL